MDRFYFFPVMTLIFLQNYNTYNNIAGSLHLKVHFLEAILAYSHRFREYVQVGGRKRIRVDA